MYGVTVADFRRSVNIYLFIKIHCRKIAGLSLEGLFEAKIISGPSYMKSSRSVRKSADSSVMATNRKWS